MTESIKKAPDIIGGAKVLLYVSIEGMKPIGRVEHIHIEKSVKPTVRLAICKYENEEGYYLFGCNSNWDSVTDTLHETLEDAIEQAEWEYEGLSGIWLKK